MKHLLVIFTLSYLPLHAYAASTEQEKEYKAIKTLMKAVKSLANSNLECKTSSHCKVIPLGEMACGGPSGFTIASTKNLNFSEIKYLGKKTISKEAAYNKRYDVQSECSHYWPLAPRCINRKCVE